MNILESIERVALSLDDGGKHNAPIRAVTSRKWLMSLGVKPDKRGGDLRVGQHPIVLLDRPEAGAVVQDTIE